MKKVSKRFLSLMLAAIMAMPVVFAMPQAAITAKAADSELDSLTIARYLVNNETTDEVGSLNLTKQGNPTWENGAFFTKTNNGAVHLTDGNYLSVQIGSLLRSSGVASNGFSVSFYGKPDSSNSNQYGRFFEFNDKGNKGTIDYNSNRDSTFYASMWPYENKIEVDNYNYGNRSYITQSGVTNNYYNAWHHYVATFANGRVCVYVDGAVGYQTDTNQMNAEALNRICVDNGYLLLGQAGWKDTGYTGWLRDFRVYKKALTSAQATKAYRQDYIDRFDVVNFNTPSFNAAAYHYDDTATGGYSNVVYSPKGESGVYVQNDYNEAGATYYKVFVPKVTVLAYDGINKVSSPIVAETKYHDKSFVGNQTISYIASNDSTVYLDKQWDGYHETDYKKWPTTTTSHFGYLTSDGRTNESGARHKNPRFWRNELVYHGSGNTSSYIETFSNISFTAGAFYTNWGNKFGTNVIGTNFNIYVINYKPIKNKLSEAQAFYNNNIAGKEWMYTDESLNQAMYALSLIGLCNPNNYNYSGDAGASAQKCALDIKNALAEYAKINLIKKQFNITFTNAAGTQVDARTITAGDGLGALPANTGIKYSDNNKHNTYSWGTISSSTVVQSNTAYTETVNSVGCSLVDDVHAATAEHNGYTDRKCSVCGHVDENQRAYNRLEWGDYNSALSNYNSKVSSDLYTTSTVATCVSDAADYIGLNNTANTPQNTPQATLDTAVSKINTAVGKLKSRANFAGLDSAYDTAQADFAALNASLYTTSTYNAANTFLSNAANFPYHSRNAASRANTPEVPDQSSIDSEADLLAAALSGLEKRADFTLLNAAKQEWVDYLSANAGKYTTSSKNTLSNYINSTTEFPLENTADRADTGVSQNTAIAAEATKYGEIDPTDYLDPLADLTYFDAEYDKANTFLMSQVGKAAEYSEASVQAVVDAVTAAGNAQGANKSVETIATSDAEERADYGQAVQTDADDFADDIKKAMDGLQKIAAVVPSGVDTSAFVAAVNKINNFDPDAYENSASISTAYAGVNAVLGTDSEDKEIQVDYDGAKINVLKDGSSITQQNVNDATSAITTALTVSTKKYIVTTQGDTGEVMFINGSLDAENKAPYGTIVKCDSGGEETAWYLEISTNSMHKELAFQGYGRRFSTKVLGTTRIKAVKKASEQKRVKIVRKYGDTAVTDKSPVQFVDYVNSGASFTLPAAPAIAFYSFDKYYIGEKEYAAGASVTVDDDTEIIARYTANASGNCAINVLSDSTQNTTVAYNTKVSLTGAEGTYGWIEAIDETHFRPFYIGKDVEFYASESTELKAVTKSEFDAFKFTLPSVNLRQNGIIENAGKKTFNAQLVKAGYDIQEYGILIAAPLTKEGSTPIAIENLLPSMVVIENSGKHEGKNAYQILRAKSTKLVGANQFAISVTSLPAQYIYRGYAIYKDAKGNLQTVYSEAMR